MHLGKPQPLQALSLLDAVQKRDSFPRSSFRPFGNTKHSDQQSNTTHAYGQKAQTPHGP
jgi:hypothetical protein